jgi:hypothetical protein
VTGALGAEGAGAGCGWYIGCVGCTVRWVHGGSDPAHPANPTHRAPYAPFAPYAPPAPYFPAFTYPEFVMTTLMFLALTSSVVCFG